jgi:hypothetical protein
MTFTLTKKRKFAKPPRNTKPINLAQQIIIKLPRSETEARRQHVLGIVRHPKDWSFGMTTANRPVRSHTFVSRRVWSRVHLTSATVDPRCVPTWTGRLGRYKWPLVIGFDRPARKLSSEAGSRRDGMWHRVRAFDEVRQRSPTPGRKTGRRRTPRSTARIGKSLYAMQRFVYNSLKALGSERSRIFCIARSLRSRTVIVVLIIGCRSSPLNGAVRSSEISTHESLSNRTRHAGRTTPLFNVYGLLPLSGPKTSAM